MKRALRRCPGKGSGGTDSLVWGRGHTEVMGSLHPLGINLSRGEGKQALNAVTQAAVKH